MGPANAVHERCAAKRQAESTISAGVCPLFRTPCARLYSNCVASAHRFTQPLRIHTMSKENVSALVEQVQAAAAAGKITKSAGENITHWLTQPSYAEYV